MRERYTAYTVGIGWHSAFSNARLEADPHTQFVIITIKSKHQKQKNISTKQTKKEKKKDQDGWLRNCNHYLLKRTVPKRPHIVKGRKEDESGNILVYS